MPGGGADFVARQFAITVVELGKSFRSIGDFARRQFAIAIRIESRGRLP